MVVLEVAAASVVSYCGRKQCKRLFPMQLMYGEVWRIRHWQKQPRKRTSAWQKPAVRALQLHLDHTKVLQIHLCSWIGDIEAGNHLWRKAACCCSAVCALAGTRSFCSSAPHSVPGGRICLGIAGAQNRKHPLQRQIAGRASCVLRLNRVGELLESAPNLKSRFSGLVPGVGRPQVDG